MALSEIQIPQAVPAASPDSPSPKKRRKRTPATGAAADCFTCTNRGLKCDRRRPYCSQCLDDGRDCAGYKTQLTWNVGVASRGKLRGLSLPIAGTQKVTGHAPNSRTKRKHSPRSDLPGHAEDEDNAIAGTGNELDMGGAASEVEPHVSTHSNQSSWELHASASSNPAPASSAQNHMEDTSTGYWNNASGIPALGTMPQQDQGRHTTRVNYNVSQGSDTNAYPAEVHPGSYFGRILNQNGLQMHGMSTSQAQFSQTYEMPFAGYSVYPQQDESYVRHDTYQSAMPPPMAPPPIERMKHEQDEEDGVEDIQRHDLEDECAIVDDVSTMSGPISLELSLGLTTFSNVISIGKSPRMQYLINYYAEVISPVIVAFDGPSNPYRTQILRLAAESETLQHAISALSASNLRQRRETGLISTGKTDPARRSSIAHMTLTDASFPKPALMSPQEQVSEETFHKSFAIQSLNQQLADPKQRKNDSILATLLILCLFHICDSGVAKFQTQFAGVKKLLSLRGKDLGVDTKEAKWFTRMFTWFDALAATVNNREGQLQGDFLEMSALSNEEWALENLAGCDGQLFKVLAKLGRLNVLSQGGAVAPNPVLVPRPAPNMPFASADYSNFDGNGWMQLLADHDLFSAKTENANGQTQFWQEWKEVRHQLQSWYIDTSMFDCTSAEAPLLMPEQRLDLLNISESFRYSALLYTERLANPAIPSSDPSIQAWVQQSLNYIKQVKSDVYLLWPLFITGSECVVDADRNVIRERCLDIQKDSGFMNNKSCLELLEKVWKTNSPKPNSVVKFNDNGFRFSRVMKVANNEGEYIVI